LKPVTPIRELSELQPFTPLKRSTGKAIKANQKALDDLSLGSGTWAVEGIPGLYVRCRAQTKSFFVQRRVNGELLNRTIGEVSMKVAKEERDRIWRSLKHDKPAPTTDQVTFAQTFEAYMEHTDLASSTVRNYRANFKMCLEDWHDRPVKSIGTEREGLRSLHQRVRKNHGDSIANQVHRLLSTIYNWHKDGCNDDTLPAFPKKAMPLITIKARDWAFDDEELKAWWHATEEKDGEEIETGVKTTTTLKRAYWLTSLFTGARPGSIEGLTWRDIDFEKRTIFFIKNKGNPAYTVPMADVLHDILKTYRDSDLTTPNGWVFPSPHNKTGHLVDVKEKQGVQPKYHLRHTFRTRLAGLGFTRDQAKMLMGHSLGGDVSSGYISAPLLIESLRPVINALASEYLRALDVASADLTFARV
jgi:integrase